MAYHIGLWGPSAAGKTAYLTQLYLQLLTSPWKIFPTPEAKEFLRSARSSTGRNRFPPATGAGVFEKVTCAVRSPTGTEYRLTLADRSGAELVDLGDAIRADLSDAHALLLLLDSEEDPQKLLGDLDGVLSELHAVANRGVVPDSRPVCIGLTKADSWLSSRAELDSAIHNPHQFALSRIEPRLDIVAGRFLSRYRFYPISAAGVFTRGGLVEAATFYDEQLELRLAAGGEPLNLFEPLAWLIAELEGPGHK